MLASPLLLEYLLFYPRAAARSAARAKPGARVTNSEMPKSFANRHYVLVWAFDLFANVIEFRGFFRINVKKSVGKQVEIIKNKHIKKINNTEKTTKNGPKEENKNGNVHKRQPYSDYSVAVMISYFNFEVYVSLFYKSKTVVLL